MTVHQSSNIAQFYVVKSDTSLVYIDKLDLDQFMKIINMFRVGIPPPESLLPNPYRYDDCSFGAFLFHEITVSNYFIGNSLSLTQK